MAFGHSFGPSGLLDFVFHALRALKPCFVACEGRWVKNVTDRVGGIPFYRVGIMQFFMARFLDEIYLINGSKAGQGLVMIIRL